MMVRKVRYVLAGCMVAGVVALAGVGGASDIGQTVKQTCSRCHTTKRICLNLGVKSDVVWKATVTRMVGKGAQLPDGQIDTVAGYLAGLAPGTGAVCE
jgi:mono/diheme cytochrome c family protein